MPSGLSWTTPGEIIWPTSTAVLRRRRRVKAAVGQHRLDAGQFVRRVASGQVVQRDHRVRLAATEVRLQLDDRVAALLAEARARR